MAEKIKRADLERLHAAGWKSRPAYLNEPQHAPKGTRFVLVIDMPTDNFRRLIPPAKGNVK
jgi:hypothetical protein